MKLYRVIDKHGIVASGGLLELALSHLFSSEELEQIAVLETGKYLPVDDIKVECLS